MKTIFLVTALLLSSFSHAGTWEYEPWQKSVEGISATAPHAAATLSTSQDGVRLDITLESRNNRPPIWVVTVSSADKMVQLQSITALNPDRVQEDNIEILDVERFEPAEDEEDERYSLSASVTPDGINNIKFSARVEVVVSIEGSDDCPTCRTDAKYTIDSSDLGLAFVEFDIDVRRLEGVDVSRAYLLEYDRKHEPLNKIPPDLWMIAPEEVEQNRVKLGLTQDEILAMSEYEIGDALYDQQEQEFDERQAARAARDAEAVKVGEVLFRTLTVFEFPDHNECSAPDIPEAVTSQEQAEAFNRGVAAYQDCLSKNQNRDAGAYSAVIGTIGYAMNPNTFEVSAPDDMAFAGAAILACENLVPEVGQCSSAIQTLALQFQERFQGINRQYNQFQANAKHLYEQ